MQPPTFTQNMQQLHRLKDQLLTLNHIFSPNSINYHQLTIVQQLQQQRKQVEQKINSLEMITKNNNKKYEHTIQKLEKQRKELEDVNMELVGYNEKLVVQLEATSQKLKMLVGELEAERQVKREMEIKHAREIQNLKLMHSQELYILKKKDKKTNL